MGLAAFIIGVIVILIGLGIAAVANLDDSRTLGIAAGAVVVFIGLMLIIIDSFTTVAPRGVAVQTAFGKVRGGTLGPGLHWVAPWNNVEEFDASVQTLKYYKDEKDDDGTCITVRLANSNTACVDVTTQWNINHEGDVKNLYLAYKTFDNIHNNLVVRQLGSALNEVFGGYDPLASLNANADTPAGTTKQLQESVKKALQDDLGSGIHIDSVTIPIVHFDGPTEDRLRALSQAKADTRIAQQKKQTAVADADANAVRAAAGANKDPGAQFQNCLDLIRDLAAKDQLKNLPVNGLAFCGGGGTPVIAGGR